MIYEQCIFCDSYDIENRDSVTSIYKCNDCEFQFSPTGMKEKAWKFPVMRNGREDWVIVNVQMHRVVGKCTNGGKCEFVDVGFSSGKRACKHCDKDEV